MTTIFFVIVPPPPFVGVARVLVGGAGVVGGCGVLVGSVVGTVVGSVVGSAVGSVVGSVVGSAVGVLVGVLVGAGVVGSGALVGVGAEVVERLLRVLGGTTDELAEDDTGGFDGALEDGFEEAEELRPGTVMLGAPVVDGTALVVITEGWELGSGSAEVEAPQPLSTTARARAGIRAEGTTRTRMAPRVPARPRHTVSNPRVSAGSPTVEVESLPFGKARMGVSRMQPGMPDLAQIVLKAQQMGDAVQRAQAALAEQSFAGTAGGNLVRAEVTGDGELHAVTIDPAAVDPADLETLGDLVVAAVRDAQRQVSDARDAIVGDATGGFDLDALGLGDMGLPLPPAAPGER